MLLLFFLGYGNYSRTTDLLIEDFNVNVTQTVNLAEKSIETYLESVEKSLLSLKNLEPVQRYNESEEYYNYMLDIFQSTVKTHDQISFAYIGTPEKDFIIYPEVEVPEGFDPTERPWYKDAIEKDELIWTAPYFTGDDAEQVVSAAIPIYNSFNNDEFG